MKIKSQMQNGIGHRRSIRLEGYDYASEGGYFITIITHHWIQLFGEVVDGEMKLSEFGRIVKEEWFKIKIMRPNVELPEDEFIVMPNHIHGIIWLDDDENHKTNETQNFGMVFPGQCTGDLCGLCIPERSERYRSPVPDPKDLNPDRSEQLLRGSNLQQRKGSIPFF